MTRIGVFLCACDGKIDKRVDVGAVESAARANSAFVARMPHACLPDGKRDLRAAILENNLEGVVVAACPARFQQNRLREVCIGAGVNLNHFALVDWREGCAWAHRGDAALPFKAGGATTKAIDLVQMGIARVQNARALDGVMARVAPGVLVIGGGIAGMTAARALADRGITVTLVEREAHLGGQLRGIPLNGAAKLFDETLDAVLYHPFIRLRLNSRISAVNGSVGNYRVEIQRDGDRFEINVGAIVVATGAQEFRDARLYRYDARRVVTLSEFAVSLATRHSSLVYILCAGSRDGHIPYCSNVCCLAALNQATRVKRANPESRVTILFRDLYLPGDELNEEIVRAARRAGVEFARYAPANPPRVEDDVVIVRDELSRETRRIAYDRIVLATPLVPRDDAGALARWFDLTRDENGFFIDPHRRVRAEHQIERGIFICGSAHRPVDADTAIMQGLTAAARAARFVQSREVMRPAFSAQVNSGLCTGDGHCIQVCPSGAIRLKLPRLPDGLQHAEVDPFLCLACGSCVVACPSKAIEMPNPSDAQILAQIDAALAARRDGEPRSLVFACEWSGIAAMELAGARRMNYPAHARVIELPCSARLDPLHVLYAFVNGADRVVVALCPPDECHFGNGNRHAEARIENLRAQLAAHAIDPQRLQIARMMGDDAGAWVRAMTEIGGSLVHSTTR
jgi:heterodisulfide reductase subunit A